MEHKSFLTACMEAYQQRSFLKAYNDTFELVKADTEELREKAFRLRYKVFCEENEFEKPPLFEMREIEKDLYDDHAVHYLLMRKVSGETAGTLRLVLPLDDDPGASFPAQELCDHPALALNARAPALCEISRFCMAQRFRKRERDGRVLPSYYEQDTVEGKVNGKVTFFRRLIPYAPAALLRGALESALLARIMEGVWLVDSCHLSSLDRIGFSYRVMGPHVPYHGGAQPVVFNIKNVLDTMRTRNPSCWDIVSDSGRLQKMADELHQNDWQDRMMDAEDQDAEGLAATDL